jgi:predicted nucleotidyltransferase
MAGEKPVADQAAVETLTGLMWGWFVSRAIYAAAELGIADLLRDGPRTVEELASAAERPYA